MAYKKKPQRIWEKKTRRYLEKTRCGFVISSDQQIDAIRNNNNAAIEDNKEI
jgi:hypothetical protein